MSKEILREVEIPKDVKQFFKELLSRTKGYDIYLGGGYLRDSYYNAVTYSMEKHPKDLDIFFVPNNKETKCIPTLPKTYVNYDKSAEEIPDMEKRGVERVRGLFVPRLDTSDVQFIVYGSFMTQEELAADMDCNINQVMYSLQDNTIYGTVAFHEGHDGEFIEMLHVFDKDRMGKRILRMKNKYPSYNVKGDWDLSYLEMTYEGSEHEGSFCE